VAAAESKDGVGSANGPEHAGLFEAVADDGFAAGFDDAGADKQMLPAKFGIAHAPGVVRKVGGFASDDFLGGRRSI